MQLDLRQKLLVVATTDDQKKAIELSGKSILVSASAGSGKTEVLSKRILSKILLKKASIKNILAMTFTNAAAAEMKNRIAKAIAKELDYKVPTEDEMRKLVFGSEANFIKIKALYENYAPLTDLEKQYLLEEQSSLLNADITTIDGFALSIVKRFFIVLENFNVESLDNLLPEFKRIEFLNQSVKEAISFNYKANYELFLAYPELNRSLKELISKLSIYPNPIEKIEEWKCISNQTSVPQLKNEYAIDFLVFRVNALRSEILESLLVYLNEIEDVKPTKKILEDKAQVEALSSVCFDEVVCIEDVEAFFEKIVSFNELKLTNSKNFSDYLSYHVKTLESNLKKIFKLVNANNEPIQDLSVFYDVLKQAYLKYEFLKKSENYIEFSDITRYAVQILNYNDDIRFQYQTHFNEILVDEFQDTNEIQDELIRLVSKNNKNVFRVGDIKQSIYGFRQAKPQVMRNYYELFDQDSEFGENIVLNINFRSSPEIIHFNNVAFNALMNVDNYPSAFSHDADFAHANAPKSNNPIEFHRLTTSNNEMSKDEQVFRYIASEISDQNYRDCAILVRSNNQVNLVSRILKEYNIPYFASVDNKLNDCEIIQLIRAIHQLCENPKDDLAYTALASSRLFRDSFDEIILAKNPKGLYFKGNQKLVAFIESLKNIEDFIERTLAILNYEKFYFNLLDNEEKLIVDYLLVLLNDAQIFTIHQGLEFIQKLKDSEYLKPVATDAKSNVVSVMNIHKSKGLEFKNVYLYCVDNDNLSTGSEMFQYHDDLGVSFVYKNDDEKKASLYHEIITQKNRVNTIEEDLRLLYVATTRPKSKLHLVGFTKYNNEPLSLSLLEGSSKFASYLLATRSKFSSEEFKVSDIDLDTYTFKANELVSEEVYDHLRLFENEVEVIETTSAHRITTVEPLVFNQVDFFQRGSDIHKKIENYGLKLINNESVDISNPKIKKLFEHPTFNQLLKMDVYFELPYSYKYEGKLESGYMDFVAVEEAVYVVDFKTDQFSDYELKTPITKVELIKRYQNQLTMYQNALKVAYPNKVIYAYIYSLELEEMIELN